MRFRVRRLARPCGLRHVALLLVAGGCLSSTSRTPPRVARPTVATERDVYRAERTRDGSVLEFTIVAAFTNLTADTVVLHPCGWQGPAVVLEKWVDGKWRRAVDRVCADVRVSNAPR